ncbi:hypothetical protein H6P81_005820 [Aristolochia fimbriata]|uniref:Uncharacterized protein n=1 Tax=Aristolochia fimbriata TaxID=158543 RepID=A0AAV7EWP8_ARIFI|nr:hypothetical protein H6P81_005820 [Aristolochia fimbriata]
MPAECVADSAIYFLLGGVNLRRGIEYERHVSAPDIIGTAAPSGYFGLCLFCSPLGCSEFEVEIYQMVEELEGPLQYFPSK